MKKLISSVLNGTSLAIAAMALLAACANGPCRQLRAPQRESAQSETQASNASSKTPGTSSAPAPAATPPTLRTAPTGASTGGPVSTTTQPAGNVFVSKADGSLQCGMGKAISAEEMEKELKGIKVLSRDKRSDGMMHIQVCGSPTGMINVYEIPASSLAEAEARGFKKVER
jgi:glucose/arabinose dehydrogenase